MPSTISPAAQINVRRVLDSAARRMLAEQVENDHERPTDARGGKVGDDAPVSRA
jgi:hypothetical protein